MTAYPSYHSLVQDVPIDQKTKPTGEEKTLAGVFGWDFFAPVEPGMDYLELLESVAQFVREDKFPDKRRAFHEQRRKLIQDKAPDAGAIAEMNRLANEYATATSASKLRGGVLNAFTVLGITASVAAAVAVPLAGLAGAFFAAFRFGAEQWLAAPITSDRRAGAMVYDSRNYFARKAKKG